MSRYAIDIQKSAMHLRGCPHETEVPTILDLGSTWVHLGPLVTGCVKELRTGTGRVIKPGQKNWEFEFPAYIPVSGTNLGMLNNEEVTGLVLKSVIFGA